MSTGTKAGQSLKPIYAAPIEVCGGASNKVPWAKPIRIYQFVVIVVLFTLTIVNESAYGPDERVFIFAVIGIFLVITLVDMISQCGSDPILDTPMFLFGVLGCILFVMVACSMFMMSRKDSATGIVILLVSMVLSVKCAILFLLDVILIFLYGY